MMLKACSVASELNQLRTRPSSSNVISVILPFRATDTTFNCVPGARRCSFSFPKKVISEMSAAVFELTVSNVHLPPHPAVNFLATAISAVQLLTPHQVTVELFGYWSNKSTFTPRHKLFCACGNLAKASNNN